MHISDLEAVHTMLSERSYQKRLGRFFPREIRIEIQIVLGREEMTWMEILMRSSKYDVTNIVIFFVPFALFQRVTSLMGGPSGDEC